MQEQNRPQYHEQMTKAIFLEQLRNGIAVLPGVRIQEIEEDIRQHFDEGSLSGATEADLCAMLGDPTDLAAEYIALYQKEQAGLMEVEVYAQTNAQERERPGEAEMPWQEKKRKRRNPLLTGTIAFWMFIFALCIPLPIWCTLGSVWIVLACGFIIGPAGVLGLVLSVLSLIVPIRWVTGSVFSVNFFGSISCIALGGLLMMATASYGRWFLRISRQYLAFHHRVVTGRGGDEE